MHDPETGSRGYTAEELRSSLTLLQKAGCKFLPLDQLMNDVQSASVQKGPLVSFTLDDGFQDQAKIAGPIFAEFDCPATFFLISGFLDRDLWPWDAQVDYVFRHCEKKTVDIDVQGKLVRLYFQTVAHQNASRRAFREYCKTIPNSQLDELLLRLSVQTGIEIPADAPGDYLPMTWSTARELQTRGIRFAPHTVSHRIVSKMTDEEARFEIEHSYARVKKELGTCVKVFAWPNGKNVDFGAREINILDDLGFLGSVHTEPSLVPLGPSRNNSHNTEWGRLGLPATETEVLRTISPLGKFRLRLVQKADSRLGGKRGIKTLYAGLVAKLLGKHRNFSEIRWDKVERLIFLCTGNVCRSAYAEAYVEAYAAAHELQVMSCGINALTNSTANHTAIQVSEERGFKLFDHRSINVDDVIFEPTDLVLGFDMTHVDKLLAVSTKFDCQVSLVGIWGNVPSNVLPDPYGCSAEYFHHSFDWIERSIDKIENHLSTLK